MHIRRSLISHQLIKVLLFGFAISLAPSCKKKHIRKPIWRDNPEKQKAQDPNLTPGSVTSDIDGIVNDLKSSSAQTHADMKAELEKLKQEN